MGSNPFLLALVGAPTLLGIYLRFSKWNPRILKVNIIASSLVLVSVGIGYIFDNQNSLPNFSNGVYKSLAVGFAVSLFSVISTILYHKDRELNSDWIAGGCWATLVVGLMTVLWIAGQQDVWLLKVPAIIFLFFSFALINSLLGAAAAGFSLSAALYSFMATGRIDYIFVWRDIFEFLEINNTHVKIMVIVVSSLAACAELLKSPEEKIRLLFDWS